MLARLLDGDGVGSGTRDDDLDDRSRDATHQEADAVAAAVDEVVPLVDQFDRRDQEHGSVESAGEHVICGDANRRQLVSMLPGIQLPVDQGFDRQTLALLEDHPEEGDQDHFDHLLRRHAGVASCVRLATAAQESE